MITSACTFDILQITLKPFCIGLNLSICTRLGCHYGLVARKNATALRVGPTLMSMELVIVYSYDSFVKVELVKINTVLGSQSVIAPPPPLFFVCTEAHSNKSMLTSKYLKIP